MIMTAHNQMTEHSNPISPPLTADLADNLTAYIALDDAFLSIASRLQLISEATSRLDLQYYLWKNDFIGQMMLSELLKAADRGVQVRLLIDDQNGTALDQTFLSLVCHPNFEIKIFNPYRYRHFRIIDYAFRFKHINQRMHNKLIIADEKTAVTGGRNMSSEYFDAGENFQFTDLDILFYGHAVTEANAVFLDFWNAELSSPIQQLTNQVPVQSLQALRQYYQTEALNKNTIEQKIEHTRIQADAALHTYPVSWAKAHFIADSPHKVLKNTRSHEMIIHQILSLMGKPQHSLQLVSAYFIPTALGVKHLLNLVNNQVQVSVLTNSLFANDVTIVHAFYRKYRRKLLEHGVRLYEFKPDIQRTRRTWYEVVTGNVISAKSKCASRLHAKFFSLDHKVFIGSFNLDPRSAYLNTEVGLIIESEALQHAISKKLDENLPHIAYELILSQQGHIVWLEHLSDGKIIQHEQEPKTTKFQSLVLKLLSYLPIEWIM